MRSGSVYSRFPGFVPDCSVRAPRPVQASVGGQVQPVLAMFNGQALPFRASIAELLKAGFDQLITGTTALSPLHVSRDPTVGAFIRDVEIPADAIGGGHMPEYRSDIWPDGRIGRFMVGRSVLGRLRGTHEKLLPGMGIGRADIEVPPLPVPVRTNTIIATLPTGPAVLTAGGTPVNATLRTG